MVPRFRLLPVVAGILLTLALPGCSDSADTPSTVPASVDPTVDEESLRAVVPLPLSGLLMRTGDVDEVFFDRQQGSIAACMSERGFDYASPEYVGLPDVLRLERPFGVWLYSEARTRGYHGPGLPPIGKTIDDYLLGLDPELRDAWLAAFNGVGEGPTGREFPDGLLESGSGGCVQRTLDDIYGDFARFDAIRLRVQDLASQAGVQALASPPVVAALDEWKACMSKSGYAVVDPAEAERIGLSTESEPDESELRQAEVDVAARKRSA